MCSQTLDYEIMISLQNVPNKLQEQRPSDVTLREQCESDGNAQLFQVTTVVGFLVKTSDREVDSP